MEDLKQALKTKAALTAHADTLLTPAAKAVLSAFDHNLHNDPDKSGYATPEGVKCELVTLGAGTALINGAAAVAELCSAVNRLVDIGLIKASLGPLPHVTLVEYPRQFNVLVQAYIFVPEENVEYVLLTEETFAHPCLILGEPLMNDQDFSDLVIDQKIFKGEINAMDALADVTRTEEVYDKGAVRWPENEGRFVSPVDQDPFNTEMPEDLKAALDGGLEALDGYLSDLEAKTAEAIHVSPAFDLTDLVPVAKEYLAPITLTALDKKAVDIYTLEDGKFYRTLFLAVKVAETDLSQGIQAISISLNKLAIQGLIHSTLLSLGGLRAFQHPNEVPSMFVLSYVLVPDALYDNIVADNTYALPHEGAAPKTLAIVE